MSDLIIKDLTVSYDKKNILEKFNLVVKNKELVVLLGPSGCGKSTLLSAISGLVKPKQGSIKFGDKYFYDYDKKINLEVENRNIGFVFQSYALWPHMSVFNNIAYPLKVRKCSKIEIKKRVSEVLSVVNMRGYENRFPNELSGGEKQRIALARSLVYNPSILLLDEPLANLDANLKTSLAQEIKSIQQKIGITMIYVTHDQSEAFEIANRIVIMNKGKIMQQGLPHEIYCECKNIFVADFIGKNNIFKSCEKKPCFLRGMKKQGFKNAITIRPEDIEIIDSGQYKGEIEDILYKGDHAEYIIKTSDTSVLACASYNNNLQKGSKISFNIKRYHCI